MRSDLFDVRESGTEIIEIWYGGGLYAIARISPSDIDGPQKKREVAREGVFRNLMSGGALVIWRPAPFL